MKYLILLAILAIITSNALAYETYEGSPHITQTWSYRISTTCSDRHVDAIQRGFDKLSNFVRVRYLSSTNLTGAVRDHSSRVFCDDTFPESLVSADCNCITISYKTAQGAVLGRATVWWAKGGQIVEIDIQIAETIEQDWQLQDIVDHELVHGLGCGHSDDPQALMYPYLGFDKGFHVDDLRCINELYGPFGFSLVDYEGRLYLPEVREIGGRDGWGVVRPWEFDVLDFGE